MSKSWGLIFCVLGLGSLVDSLRAAEPARFPSESVLRADYEQAVKLATGRSLDPRNPQVRRLWERYGYFLKIINEKEPLIRDDFDGKKCPAALKELRKIGLEQLRRWYVHQSLEAEFFGRSLDGFDEAATDALWAEWRAKGDPYNFEESQRSILAHSREQRFYVLDQIYMNFANQCAAQGGRLPDR